MRRRPKEANMLKKTKIKTSISTLRPLGRRGMAMLVIGIFFSALIMLSARAPAQQSSPSFGCPTVEDSNCICEDDRCHRQEEIELETPSTPPQERGGQCPAGVNMTSFDYEEHFDHLIELLKNNWIAALMMMTEQFTAVMMKQMMIIGSFMDAKHQLESQRLINDLQTQTHENYHSSMQMCRFGTNVKSLAASDMLGRYNARALNKIMLDREKLASYSAGAAGTEADYRHRIRQFGELYCTLFEANARIAPMCFSSDGPVERIGNDIDFTRTVDLRYTLDIDFTNEEATPDEVDIIALSKNLFGSDLFPFIAENLLEQPRGQEAFLDMRSVMAIRSVARHSFSTLIGMKSSGAPEVAPFIKKIVEELGMPEEEIDLFIGENPSYFAQMEVLTKKMYQNPVFYTNLYDKPENVVRTGVAMQAIKLMQDRDRYESAQRRELMISLILELKLREYQNEMNRRLYGIIPSILDAN